MKKEKDRRERNQNQVSEIDKLPFDIIFDILSRLPIRSVLQCRRVCKSWLRVSRSPEFATAHLSQSIHTNPIIILQKIGFPRDPFEFYYLLEGDEFNPCREFTGITTWMDKPNIIEDFGILGSCNGLICMYESYPSVRVYLFNPLTQKYLALSLSTQTPCLSSYTPVLGFGFDSNTKTYKVVKIVQSDGDDATMVEEYTLGTGYWRNKGSHGVPYKLDPREKNIFVNGAVHWTCIEGNGENHPFFRRFIVSFDLGDEEFRVIPVPDYNPVNAYTHFTGMGVIKGCLFMSYYSSRRFIDMWLMKEYGVKESWSKAYMIRLPIASDYCSDFIPLGLDKNDELLLWDQARNKVAAFNAENQMFTSCESHPLYPLVFTYVGSLITVESACGGKNMSEMERKNIKKKTESPQEAGEVFDSTVVGLKIGNSKPIQKRSRRGNVYRQ